MRHPGRSIRSASPVGFALMFLEACAAGGGGSPAPMTRTYYIAAEETTWDYAPGDTNRMTGRPWSDLEKPLVTPGPDRIGKVYQKAIYREYTDSTFTTAKPRAPEWAHLGILGPLIRGVVGDTIKVVFLNRGTHPYSVHPHGVFYNKDSEGAPYADGTSGKDKADDGVAPGTTHVYTWPVPARAGPGPMDPSSVVWMYHSHVDEMLDVNAGLIGPMIVTARPKARADGSPNDVDRELVVLFGEFDENLSWFRNANVQKYVGQPTKVPANPGFADPFYVGNLRETLNGFSFGYLPDLVVRRGQRVRWYLFALTGFEFHAPHWHGNTVLVNGMRTDVSSLTAMEMVTADMVPDNAGIWMFHCHVSVHLAVGMQGVYRVE